MISLDKTIITREMIDAAADCLASEPPLFGESITKFEEEFARFCGTDFAVSVGSGTDALIFTLMAAGVEGKKVLTTPSSYIATPNSAFHAGGKPVFCDIDPETNCIAPAEIAKALKKDGKIRAIIPVHLHGYPCAMGEIKELAGEKGIFLLEDACQAHGASFKGKMVGSIGDAGAFSFNPVKNMTIAGDGGMVTTNDEKIAKKVRMLADSGRESPYTHRHDLIGFTSRIDSVGAAIGRIQLRHLPEWNEERRRIAGEYRRRLADAGIELPAGQTEYMTPVYNKFAIKAKDARERESLKDFLYDSGAYTDSHYPIPLHLQPPYLKLGYRKGDFPKAERFADRTLSLPLFVGISAEETGLVSDKISEFYRK